MSDLEEVKILSKRKQRLSLGQSADRKKKKGKKGSDRNTLVWSEIQWPEYHHLWANEFIMTLQRLLIPMKLPDRKVPLTEIRKVDRAQRSEFRRQWMLEERSKSGYQISSCLDLRSCVVLGVNCVSKGLERGTLAGAVVDKGVNPDIITKLIIPIAEGKGVPIVAIDGLNSMLKLTCGIRCIALGLKTSCAQSTNHFFPLLEMLRTSKTHQARLSPNPSTADSKQGKPGSSKSTPSTNTEPHSHFKKKKVRKFGF